MDATEVQQRTRQISVEDTEIRQALAELEEKLAVWFEAYSSLAESAPGIELPTEPEAPSESAAPKGLLVRDVDSEPAIESADPEQSETEQAEHEQAPQPMADSEHQGTAGGDSGKPGEEEQQQREDDEELLSTLDPEVATSIRVKRRLGNNTRSIRELLDEYEQEQGTGKGQPRRKRWWR